jgi:hypothetical protein
MEKMKTTFFDELSLNDVATAQAVRDECEKKLARNKIALFVSPAVTVIGAILSKICDIEVYTIIWAVLAVAVYIFGCSLISTVKIILKVTWYAYRYTPLYIVDLGVGFVTLCVMGTFAMMFPLFYLAASRYQISAEKEAAEEFLNPASSNRGMMTGTAVFGEPIVNASPMNAVPVNTEAVSVSPVAESEMSLDEQIAALKSIMEDVRPVSALESSFFQKCVEGCASAEQDKIGWFTFNTQSVMIGIKAMGIGFLCGFLPICLIFSALGNKTVGCWIGFVVMVAIYFYAGQKFIKQANETIANVGKCEDELNRIQEQAKAILVSASGKCKVLHPIYCYPQALYNIVQYLERGRASGIKEAINLFENELNGISVQEQNQMLLYFRLREVL